MKKNSSASSKNPSQNLISSMINFTYTTVAYCFSNNSPEMQSHDNNQREVNALMEKFFPNENKGVDSPTSKKDVKKTAQKKHVVKISQEKNFIRQNNKIDENEYDDSKPQFSDTNLDNTAFTTFFKKPSSFKTKILILINDLKETLNHRDDSTDIITKHYENLNYLFRFFECLKNLFEKYNKAKTNILYKKIKSLRILLIHQLPFFSTQHTLVDKFIAIVIDALSKNSNQLELAINAITQNEIYNRLIELPTEPLKKNTRTISPESIIFEIKALLSHLNHITENIKTVTHSTTHAIIIMETYYWELVNRYHQYQKHDSKYNPSNFIHYQQCLDLLTSHEKCNDKNKLTRFSKSLRDYIVAHISWKMLDENGTLLDSLKNTDVYNASHYEIVGVDDVFEFNTDLFIEHAQLAKKYLDLLDEILGEENKNMFYNQL